MKRILITGENSYIGTSFETYLSQFPEAYQVETISVRGDGWREVDFSSYDVLFHVAGIAHRKETKENQALYYQVNYELVKEVADKAKREGISQFIFLSSMSVYGLENGVITPDINPKPKTAYGKSKLMAENYLKELAGDSFDVAILRPPMVYGLGCKGNYRLLSKFAKKTPVFPKINNQRSMIFIDNLSYAVELIIKKKLEGVIVVQNKEYVTTHEMIKEINNVARRKVVLSKMLVPIVKIGIRIHPSFRKIFGTLIYSRDSNHLIHFLEIEYFDFSKSILLSEGKVIE